MSDLDDQRVSLSVSELRQAVNRIYDLISPGDRPTRQDILGQIRPYGDAVRDSAAWDIIDEMIIDDHYDPTFSK